MAEHRHKRETHARRFPPMALVAAPLAVLATVGAVTSGVVLRQPASSSVTSATALSAALADVSDAASDRPDTLSRGGSRLDRQTIQDLRRQQRAYERQVDQQREAHLDKLVRQATQAGDKQWTTTTLNLWSSAAEEARDLGELPAGSAVLLTGREKKGRVEVIVKGEVHWVTAGYLSQEKPPTAAAGLSMAPCPDPSVENGLTDRAVYVYRSVCHAFPQITSYGGWDAHGEHASGRALDIMTSDVALGNAIAEFLQSHASELHLYDILWRQHIWTPVRASEGWRSLPSRGSATANHYDHVHVAVY
ncbi:MAG: mucin-2 protein [Nocardioidaceae bacterium]